MPLYGVQHTSKSSCEEVYTIKIETNTCLVEKVCTFREEELHGSEDNEPLDESAHIHHI